MRSSPLFLLLGAFVTTSLAAPVRDCPELAARDVPSSVEDLRPDDFSVIMAIGDSISAGLFAVKHDDSALDTTHMEKRGGVIDEAYGVSHTSKPKSTAPSTPPAASASPGTNQANANAAGSGGYQNSAGNDYHNWHKMTDYGHGWKGNIEGGNAEALAAEQVVAHGGWRKVVPGQAKRDLTEGEVGTAKRAAGFIEEFRGRSFMTGGDEGVGSLGNYISGYRSRPVKGLSYGHHPPSKAFLPLSEVSNQRPLSLGVGVNNNHCPEEDGLNAAISGAKAKDLVGQLENYLLPAMDDLGVRDDEWKLLTLFIGANDICDYCLISKPGHPGLGSAEAFGESVREALEVIRERIPRVVVEVIPPFRISGIYNLSHTQPYCKPLSRSSLQSQSQSQHQSSLPNPFPPLPIECQCAWAPGILGDRLRAKMDRLGEAYERELRGVVEEFRREKREDFGILWQPSTFLSLSSFPSIALSPVDCFHPSAEAHEVIATGLWNRLTEDEVGRGREIRWGEGRRCLREDDRLKV